LPVILPTIVISELIEEISPDPLSTKWLISASAGTSFRRPHPRDQGCQEGGS